MKLIGYVMLRPTENAVHLRLTRWMREISELAAVRAERVSRTFMILYQKNATTPLMRLVLPVLFFFLKKAAFKGLLLSCD